MKTVRRSSQKRKIDLLSESFSPSNAKTYLGRLVHKAGKGETVYILSGGHLFGLQMVPPNDPIPVRPAGYFANCYTKEEIREQNQLAKKSAVRPPADLE
jgi:hypothetical protein